MLSLEISNFFVLMKILLSIWILKSKDDRVEVDYSFLNIATVIRIVPFVILLGTLEKCCNLFSKQKLCLHWQHAIIYSQNPKLNYLYKLKLNYKMFASLCLVGSNWSLNFWLWQWERERERERETQAAIRSVNL